MKNTVILFNEQEFLNYLEVCEERTVNKSWLSNQEMEILLRNWPQFGDKYRNRVYMVAEKFFMTTIGVIVSHLTPGLNVSGNTIFVNSLACDEKMVLDAKETVFEAMIDYHKEERTCDCTAYINSRIRLDSIYTFNKDNSRLNVNSYAMTVNRNLLKGEKTSNSGKMNCGSIYSTTSIDDEQNFDKEGHQSNLPFFEESIVNDDYVNYLLNQVKSQTDDMEYQVFVDVVINDRKFNEIGDNMGICSDDVRKIYKKVKRRIKGKINR